MKVQAMIPVILFIVLAIWIMRAMGMGMEMGMENFDSKPCNVCNVEKHVDGGGVEAGCGGYACGWNNSVSSANYRAWAPEELKGKMRVFKYPHYYGYGTGSGFHYGEPYYVRSVDY
jgi:hypothetical protein